VEKSLATVATVPPTGSCQVLLCAKAAAQFGKAMLCFLRKHCWDLSDPVTACMHLTHAISPCCYQPPLIHTSLLS
jgi:hypothetical protein